MAMGCNAAAGDVEQLELVFGFDIDQQNSEVERFLKLPTSLADPAEYDVLALESR